MKRILISVLFLVSACGDGNGKSGDSISIDDLGPQLLDALCSRAIRCGLAPDKSGCAEGLYARQQLYADVKAGKVIYDGHAAAACLDFYGTAGCNLSDETSSAHISQLQSCRETAKGTVGTGGACVASEQCQSQACDKSACTTTSECCAGTCVARRLLGEDCSALGASCADDLFCKWDDTGTTGICTALIADGQPCTRTDLCVQGRACNPVAGTSAGTCGVLPARGDECPAMGCDSSADFCDPASKTCLGRVPLGNDCTGLPTGCVVYAKCDAATMKCVARERAGEPCGESSDCLPGVECTGGVCVQHADEPACI